MAEAWVNVVKPVMIPGTPLRASVTIPILLFAIHIRWWTFSVLIGVIVWMIFLKIKGRSGLWLWRKLKARARGYVVSARPVWYRRRFNRLESFDEFTMKEVNGRV